MGKNPDKWRRNGMKREQRTAAAIEKWIKKLIVLHLIFLIFSQLLLEFEDLKPYLNKSIQYEGVVSEKEQKQFKQ
jgi:hypothetical protein